MITLAFSRHVSNIVSIWNRGFEDPTCPVTVSFQKQANYYLDLADCSFQYHHSFIFVVVNTLQRRAAHLHTAFTVSQSRFKAVSGSLLSVSPHTLSIAANHLENEGKVSDLTAEQKKVFDLLNEVNTVSARIPGSQASKIFCHNEFVVTLDFLVYLSCF